MTPPLATNTQQARGEALQPEPERLDEGAGPSVVRLDVSFEAMEVEPLKGVRHHLQDGLSHETEALEGHKGVESETTVVERTARDRIDVDDADEVAIARLRKKAKVLLSARGNVVPKLGDRARWLYPGVMNRLTPSDSFYEDHGMGFFQRHKIKAFHRLSTI